MTFHLRNIPLFGFLGTIKYYLFIESYYYFLSRFGKRRGVSDSAREVPLIVSLTSFSERLGKLHLCIEALLRQTLKPDRIILWLSETEHNIPDSLTRLQKRGLEIKYCKDIRSYTKIIYTLKEYPQAIIVTADDDLLYPKNWLEELYAAYCNEPDLIHCHRAHLMTTDNDGKLLDYRDWKFGARNFQGPSMLLFPTGIGGVLYPPGVLGQQVFDEETFQRLCPTADDVWLKAMSMLNNVFCKKTTPQYRSFIQIKGTQEKALWKINTQNGMNDIQIKATFEHFDLYTKFK